jgi:hypothetical protein
MSGSVLTLQYTKAVPVSSIGNKFLITAAVQNPTAIASSDVRVSVYNRDPTGDGSSFGQILGTDATTSKPFKTEAVLISNGDVYLHWGIPLRSKA